MESRHDFMESRRDSIKSRRDFSFFSPFSWLFLRPPVLFFRPFRLSSAIAVLLPGPRFLRFHLSKCFAEWVTCITKCERTLKP